MDKTIIPALCAVFLGVGAAQEVPYVGDVSDPAKFARSPDPVMINQPANFHTNIILADVTKVGGAPAKGVLVIRSQTMLLSPSPAPGGAIADVTRLAYAQLSWEFLKPDGSVIGSIFGMGLSGGVAAPGAPGGVTSGGAVIVGGSGAFVGVRGTINNLETVNVRTTSQAEDPSKRRNNGGGHGRFVFQVFPMFRPEVVADAGGPQIFHADDTPVTADSPARQGENLTVNVKGLGPTRPGVNPGDPFPANPLASATSPIDVVVNGVASLAIEAAGMPGATDTYRVKFHVPDDAPTGTASIQLSAAWITGSAVRFAVR